MGPKRGKIMARPRIQLIDAERYELPIDPNIDLPSLAPYVLLDDDIGECRAISWNEMEPDYIDTNILSLSLRPDPFNMNQVDEQEALLVLLNGQEAQLTLNEITVDNVSGIYYKSFGIVWPVDNDGFLLLNSNTTPNLVAFKDKIHEIVAELSRMQVMLGEIVFSFSQCMTTDNLGQVIEEIRRDKSLPNP